MPSKVKVMWNNFQRCFQKKKIQKFFFLLGSYKLPILCYSLVCFKRKEGTVDLVYKLWFMLRIGKKLYFKSVYIPQISLSLNSFLPSCIRINLTFTLKGSFTFHKEKKKQEEEETNWKQVFFIQQRNLYVWRLFLLLMTFY